MIEGEIWGQLEVCIVLSLNWEERRRWVSCRIEGLLLGEWNPLWLKIKRTPHSAVLYFLNHPISDQRLIFNSNKSSVYIINFHSRCDWIVQWRLIFEPYGVEKTPQMIAVCFWAANKSLWTPLQILNDENTLTGSIIFLSSNTAFSSAQNYFGVWWMQ
jgi:hypothetical protein